MSLHPPAATRPRIVLAVLSVLAMLGVLVATQSPASAGWHQGPPPTSMTVRAYTDPSSAQELAGVPAAALPAVLAAAEAPFRVEVSLWKGSKPAAFPDDRPVTFTADGPGALSLTQGVLPGGQSTTTFTMSYSAASSAVTITAQAGAGSKGTMGTKGTKGTTGTTGSQALSSASTAAFPVDRVLGLLDGQSASLRDGTAGADGAACDVVDEANPMCGVVHLQHGATGTVALSLGLCPADQACAKGGFITQLIANLTTAADADDPTATNLYTRSDPATMVIKCDKSICGNRGVPHFTALWSQAATGDLEPVPACTKKGVIDAQLDFCTDYRASNRGTGGELRLVVLFLTDVRGGI